ncbi:unnamed protein product [Adineta steineri]|uniref:G-protein coupled receptors family 1 profile domain-containing protein n=1 Tax=Adineta steineri TaxID=433720 RepID=A0A814V485_9BILA|nr:unnamed protein product [Adineta steineri]CAF1414816.1 unnamed protein product [Adineta steineri]CAF1431984.1 unnamed protein product [Adineta steineri]CAF1624709.1 unnamed protein product [Adineta steineri]
MFLTKLKNNVCSFYLLTAEITDTLTLLIYVLPATVGLIYRKNGTQTNLVWCKLINWASDTTNLISTLMLCLASIDRYLCSSRRIQLRKWSSMKVAKISVVIVTFCSFLLAIPDILYWNIDTNIQQCVDNEIYLQYASYFLIPVMFSFVPLIILSVFGYKTYRNLQHIHPVHQGDDVAIVSNHQQAHRRQRLDSQLSRMLIPQILLFLFQTITFFSVNLYITVTYELPKSDLRMAMENLFQSIIFVFYETYTAASFYIYYAHSKAFRVNVKKLLMKHRRRDDNATAVTRNTGAPVRYHSGTGITMPAGH